jgi:hypothetical protein
MREIINTMLSDSAYVIKRTGGGILWLTDVAFDVLTDGHLWFLIGWTALALFFLTY